MAQSPGQNPDQTQGQAPNQRRGAISRYRPSDSILCGDSGFDADKFLTEYGAENAMYTDLPVPMVVGYGEISAPCYQGDGVILITPLWSRPLIELLRKLNSEGIKAVRLHPRTNRPMLIIPFITISPEQAYEMAKRVWDMRDTLSELLDGGVAEYGSFERYDLGRDILPLYLQTLAKMYLKVPVDEMFAPRRPAQQPQAN
jgi:hypothetical protein